MALNFANNNSLSAITTKPSGLSGGALNLISTQTASSSSTISFTSGIDDTYDSYVFKFYDIHPATNGGHFTFNGSTDSGSNYNVTKTTTWFFAYHNEADSQSALTYSIYNDLAQSTDFQILASDIGNENDESASGEMFLYNPSSTTFVKHFISQAHDYNSNDYANNMFCSGYLNTTSAINAVQFKMNSGNFDGVIKLYGIS
nr:hypothetical protein [uncultured Mediterranean phage uvMED]